MASRPDPAIDLTDAEKRDLIAQNQAGKPLPEKYRFIRHHHAAAAQRGVTAVLCRRAVRHAPRRRPARG